MTELTKTRVASAISLNRQRTRLHAFAEDRQFAHG
jgi:hypothetical protein